MRSKDDEIARVRTDVRRRYDALLTRLIGAGVLTSEEVASLPAPIVTVVVHEVG